METNLCIYGQLFTTKLVRIYSGEKIVFLINGARKTGESHAKELLCTTILYHLQKIKCIKDLNVTPKPTNP